MELSLEDDDEDAVAAYDFAGHAEDLRLREERYEKMKRLLAEHEEWRQTTWSGFLVRTLQAIGKHIAPFIEMISKVMNAEENTPIRLLLTTLVRILMITAYVLAAYAVGHILSRIFGKEIIIEEEVIIEEDDDNDDVVDQTRNDKDANERQQQTKTTKSPTTKTTTTTTTGAEAMSNSKKAQGTGTSAKSKGKQQQRRGTRDKKED